MEFIETSLKGAYIVELQLLEDERGFFARSYCRDEFAGLLLAPCLTQCNVSLNKRRGTIRGMHYQAEPYPEAKLVRCTSGAIYDVIIDLRADSPTYRQWYSVELTAKNHRAVYIPHGFAHGFQTLVDETEVFYQMSELYYPEYARGIRWDDPAFGIRWISPDVIISQRDGSYPLWEEQRC
jgi:dTDP-4-dehydrorhamnose 3,5-epimerase